MPGFNQRFTLATSTAIAVCILFAVYFVSKPQNRNISEELLFAQDIELLNNLEIIENSEALENFEIINFLDLLDQEMNG